jgi:hypothetical protein
VSGKDPIEEALQRMRPVALPAHLMARLTAARTQARKQMEHSAWMGVLLRWSLPLAASACVAVATFFWLERNRSPAGSGKPAVAVAPEHGALPMESADYFLGARPVGIVVAPNQRPYRVMEVEWIEHDTMRAGVDGSALHTATRRRDVIPVALELY